jgi:hypothetical protein
MGNAYGYTKNVFQLFWALILVNREQVFDNSILLYVRQSIVEREGLEHDERSEDCSKGTSSTTCLEQRV